MKKSLRFKKSALCFALTAAMTSSYAVCAADVLSGDINGDGMVNASDIVSFREYFFGISNSDAADSGRADINSDGTVNIADYILLVNKFLNDETDSEDVQENVIKLSGNSVSFSGKGAVVSGCAVTVSEPGIYRISGKLDDGHITVDIDKEKYPDGKAELVLEGADISSSDDSPIYIASAGDECVITVKKGTENFISDSSDYTNADGSAAAIYSKDDLKIKGKGKLTVNGNCSDGIAGKDSVKIFNGNITVNAADDGIRGKDSVKIGDADADDYADLVLTVNSLAGDGIKSSNADDADKGKVIVNGGTVTIKSFGDGIQAESDVKINGGDLNIYTYKGSSYTTGQSAFDGNPDKMPSDLSAKGIKSSGEINISGGNIIIDSTDDAVHGGGNVSVTGGVMEIRTADDAVHSDKDLVIGSGTPETFDDLLIYVPKCYEGIEGQNITQNSGTCIVYSADDGYNAAGGADGSGMTGQGGWNQGGWGRPGGMTGGGNYSLNLKGGFAFVSAADGDHDGFDSNGSITLDGAIAVSNGNEAFDSDGTKSFVSGTFVELSGGGNGEFGGRPGGFGGSSSGFTASFTSSVSANAGDRITVSDQDGNVIVSFIAGKKVSSCSVGNKNITSGKVTVGGEIAQASALPVTGDSQQVYTGGKIL